MSCSAVRLALIYHRAVVRMVPSSSAGRCVVSVPGSREVTSVDVDLWTRAKVKDGELAAEGIRGGVYVFSEKILRHYAAWIINTVKSMPKEIRRSVSPEGIPWIYCMRTEQLYGYADDDLLERIIAMAMALGVVQNLGVKGEAALLPYVSVDDVGLSRKERVKDKKLRTRSLLYW